MCAAKDMVKTNTGVLSCKHTGKVDLTMEMYCEGSLLLVREPHSQGAELSVIAAALRTFRTNNSNENT